MTYGDHPLDTKDVVGLIDTEVSMENGTAQVPLIDVHTYMVGPAPCLSLVQAVEGKYISDAVEDRAEHGLVTQITGTAQFVDDSKANFAYGRDDAGGWSFTWNS